jgi:hypothetical protein
VPKKGCFSGRFSSRAACKTPVDIMNREQEERFVSKTFPPVFPWGRHRGRRIARVGRE